MPSDRCIYSDTSWALRPRGLGSVGLWMPAPYPASTVLHECLVYPTEISAAASATTTSISTTLEIF